MPASPVEFGYRIPISIGLVVLGLCSAFYIGYETAAVHTLERRINTKTGRNGEKTENNEARIRAIEDRTLILEFLIKQKK